MSLVFAFMHVYNIRSRQLPAFPQIMPEPPDGQERSRHEKAKVGLLSDALYCARHL